MNNFKHSWQLTQVAGIALRNTSYGLETGTLRLQRPRLVVVSRGPQGHDVTLGLGLGYMSFRCEL